MRRCAGAGVPVLRCELLALSAMLVWGAGVAQAQPRWEIDFHVGGLTGTDAMSGAGTLPPVGAAFPIPNPFTPQSSRRVSSWFFGDGPQLFTTATRQSLNPLDSVLTSASATRRGGPGIGLRLGRRVGERWSVAVSLDYGRGLAISSASVDQIETVRASFESAFGSMSVPIADASAVAVVAHEDDGSLMPIVSVTYDFLRRGRAATFVMAGAGAISRLGDEPEVSLVGQYRTAGTFLVNGVPISVLERDEVLVHYRSNAHAFVSTIGAGVRLELSPRWQLRFEGAGLFVRDRLDVMVDARPSTQPPPPTGSLAVIVGSNPAVVFSNAELATRPPNSPIIPLPSSLSGPVLENFGTFSGRATQARFSATVGLGLRF